MKSRNAPEPRRRYNQTARARAAEATGHAIVDAFIKRLREQWLEEITLELVAQDAGVTAQTVIRRFGGKEGLLEAAIRRIGKSVEVRRPVRSGDVDFAVSSLANDYEEVGELIVRLLSQEARHPALTSVLDHGRRGHREWLEKVFGAQLDTLTPAKRRAAVDTLFVATGVYIWKVARRDMGRPLAAYKAIVKTLMEAALRQE